MLNFVIAKNIKLSVFMLFLSCIRLIHTLLVKPRCVISYIQLRSNINTPNFMWPLQDWATKETLANYAVICELWSSQIGVECWKKWSFVSDQVIPMFRRTARLLLFKGNQPVTPKRREPHSITSLKTQTLNCVNFLFRSDLCLQHGVQPTCISAVWDLRFSP